MNELEKNVKQLVASKVLKDIHKIVDEENIKEQKEKYWGLVSVALIVFVVCLAAAYLMITRYY